MNIQEVKQLLINAGFPNNSLLFALAQCCFESGGVEFNSPVDLANNNLTGITYANGEGWQHNATCGTPMPPQDSLTGHYAHFATMQDWANDFHRIVHAQFSWNRLGRPIEATTLEDYVARLKDNHYFQADESVYLNGLKHYLNILNQA